MASRRLELDLETELAEAVVDGFLRGDPRLHELLEPLAIRNVRLKTHGLPEPLGEIVLRCFVDLELENELIPLLSELKVSNKYDRIRLYVLNPLSSALEGFLALGGVDVAFQRVRIQLASDMTSQLLLRTPGCIRFIRFGNQIEAYGIFQGRKQVAQSLTLPDLFAHATSTALSAPTAWMDVALVDADQLCVGKLSIDCVRSEDVTLLDPQNHYLWQQACKAGELISRYMQRHFPARLPPVTAQLQAMRYVILREQIRTVLLQMKQAPELKTWVDGIRVYLSNDVYTSLFQHYLRARNLGESTLLTQQGFVGVAEVGEDSVSAREMVLVRENDALTYVIAESNKDEFFRQRLLAGEPIVFSQHASDTEAIVPRLRVANFHKQSVAAQQGLLECLELPLLGPESQIVGKLTIDSIHRSAGTIPTLDPEIIEFLTLKLGPIIARIVVNAARIPDEQLVGGTALDAMSGRAIDTHDGEIPQTGSEMPDLPELQLHA